MSTSVLGGPSSLSPSGAKAGIAAADASASLAAFIPTGDLVATSDCPAAPPESTAQKASSVLRQLLPPPMVSCCTAAQPAPTQQGTDWASPGDSAGDVGTALGEAVSDGSTSLHQLQRRLRLLGPNQEYPACATFNNSNSFCTSSFFCDPVEQNGFGAASWGVLEQQQQRLECLQQTINYCEERCNMGRALRAREAAARARLLFQQQQEQQKQQKQRQQRNSRLLEEAVSWALKKTMTPQRPAEQQLSLCLAVLHEHMQRRLSPTEFAVAATTPGIGGTNAPAVVSPSGPTFLRQQARQQSAVLDGNTARLQDASRSETKPSEALAGGESSSCSVSTAVLYKGAADAAAARELIQTRAALLLQQGRSSSSGNMQRVLSLEGEARACVAMLNTETTGNLTTAAAATAYKSEGQDCCESPSIPDEAPGIFGETTLLSSTAQRLITHSQQQCKSSRARQRSNHRSQKKNADVAGHRSSSNKAEGTPFGEQQWLNLASQVSVLQQMLLKTQQQHEEQQRKKRSGRQKQHIGQTAGAGGPPGVAQTPEGCSASSARTHGVLGSPKAPAVSTAAATHHGTAAHVQSDATVGVSRCIAPLTLQLPEKYSAAEERLRKQQQRKEQQRQHNGQMQYQHRHQGTIQSGGHFRSRGDKPVTNELLQECCAPASRSSSSRSTPPGGIHLVRSRSGTPLPPGASSLLQETRENQCVQSPVLETKTSEAGTSNPLPRRLPPMAKAAPAGARGGPLTPRPPVGQLRPYPPPGTPRARPPAASASTEGAATNVRQEKRHQLQGEVNSSSHLDGSSSSNSTIRVPGPLEKSRGLPAFIGGLPPPTEVADLLMGL